jgi:glutathione synthase/RimK-type ligase-like ATP-grasp enzyme
VAVAASAQFPDLRPDWPLLRTALAERGISATTQVWNDPAVDWNDLDLVVANGAWDNIHHPEAFLSWAEDVARATPVVNSPATLRWNMDKRYLAALASAGVPTVPTRWVEEPAHLDSVEPPAGDFVVKPTVSGGGYLTARYAPGDAERAEARAHMAQLLEAGVAAMLQPYLPDIDTEAERGLVFLGGRFSHAIRKGPLLPPGTRAGPGLYNDQVISPIAATPTQVAVATHALEVAERLLGPTTYARVDLVPMLDGGPAVLELELLDPALFIEYHPERALRFAEVLEQALTDA